MPLSSLTALWLQESLGVFSEKTLAHYRALIENHAVPFFGDRTDISRGQVLAFMEKKKAEGCSETTVFAVLRVLSRVLEYGAGQGLCPAPSWGIDFQTPQKKREIVILSKEGEQKLISYLTRNVSPLNLSFFLILTAGLTYGEAMGARWEDVSLKGGVIRVSSSREVPIGERQRMYLRKLSGKPGNYLCSGTEEPCSKATVSRQWNRVLAELRLPACTLTDLRHTFAVRSLEGGMNYASLAPLLGVDNSRNFRAVYRELVAPEHRERLESEQIKGRKTRTAPKHRRGGPMDPEAAPYRLKLEARREELRNELEALEGDLAILRNLRYADGLQGGHRQAFYNFVERILPGDKDAMFAVAYLRANMRIAEMPLLEEVSAATIRRRVLRGFSKLAARLGQICASPSEPQGKSGAVGGGGEGE